MNARDKQVSQTLASGSISLCPLSMKNLAKYTKSIKYLHICQQNVISKNVCLHIHRKNTGRLGLKC